ncbi:MAG TPA: hypothetical protein VMP00_00560 [Burkholderiales bacterium]|nr:hypothetical protein [Burkholderiales bacterium]
MRFSVRGKGIEALVVLPEFRRSGLSTAVLALLFPGGEKNTAVDVRLGGALQADVASAL